MSRLIALLLIASPLVFSTPLIGPHDSKWNDTTGLLKYLAVNLKEDPHTEFEEAVLITHDPNAEDLEPLIRKMIKRESSDTGLRVHDGISSLTRQEALSQGIWAELSAPKIHKRPLMTDGKRVATVYWWIVMRRKPKSQTLPKWVGVSTQNPMDTLTQTFFGKHRFITMKNLTFSYTPSN